MIFHYTAIGMGGSFRENLRIELDYQDITVKELSGRTGIPIATLDCYLGTRATEPSAENAVKIAQALRVTVEFLVTGEQIAYNKPRKSLYREAREIIRWVEDLNSEQCKAVLRLVKAFRG